MYRMVDYLQERIACLQGIEDDFHLHCNGSLLADETCVNELSSDVLELIVPLLGGKLTHRKYNIQILMCIIFKKYFNSQIILFIMKIV